MGREGERESFAVIERPLSSLSPFSFSIFLSFSLILSLSSLLPPLFLSLSLSLLLLISVSVSPSHII